jgi:sugar phosphate isomerase/epimerase
VLARLAVTLGPDDLVLCSGTLPRDISFRERLDAAVAGGFRGVSIWGRDYERARADGLSDADLRALLDEHGLEVAELDPAWWWLPGAADVHIPDDADTMHVFRYGQDAMFTIADAVGARSLNATDVFGGPWGVDEAAAAFGALCDRAAEHGLVVHLEGLPWSQIPDVGTAWEIVRRAGRPNGGIAVDAWHFFRAGADFDALRAVPGNQVLGIQLDDGPAMAEENLVRATLHDRLLPGDGAFDLHGLVATLRAMGAVAPMGVEVFSDALHARGAVAAARAAGDATRRVLGTVR